MERAMDHGRPRGRTSRPTDHVDGGPARREPRSTPRFLFRGWTRAGVLIVLLMFMAACMIQTGCAKSPNGESRRYREIGLAAFASPEATNGDEKPERVVGTSDDFDAFDDEPWFEDDTYEAVPMAPGDRAVVESMVGQVNGQPIFADEFFEPIEDELIALAEQLPPREFDMAMRTIVSTELEQVVLNALILAEARSNLSPEERFGVLAWLRSLEETLVAESGGNSVEMEQRLREEEGTSLQGYLSNIEDEALINKVLAEEIRPRIIVSWRDIELEYQRQYDKFNTPGALTVARIRIPTSRTAQIEEVTNGLAAGEAFMTLVESTRQRDEGIWQIFEIDQSGRTDTSALREDLVMIKEKVTELEQEGDRTDAFEVGATTWWLYALEVEPPQQRDLYQDPEVQRLLAGSIRGRRGAEEQQRYINSLFAEGILDDIEDMQRRLIKIAERRYAPRER